MPRRLRWFFRIPAFAGMTVWAVAAQESGVPVTVTRAVAMPVAEELPLTGSVTHRRLSRISPLEEGLVARLYAERGDAVKEGDLLLELDDELARIDADRSAAEVKEAEAEAAEARRLRDEAEGLLEKKHIPLTVYKSRLAQVAIREAALERLRQESKRQRAVVARHSAYAPFDGVITARFVEQGEWVNTDAALFELTEIGVLRVTAPVPQHFFPRVEVGTEVVMRLDAWRGREFRGRVERKIPRGSDGARTFPVLIDLDNSEGLFAPGMSARVVFHLEAGDDSEAVLLPEDAVIRQPDGGEAVWVVEGDGRRTRARRVTVRTGRQYRDRVEIVGGEVRPGERVVVRGNERLSGGEEVSVIEEVGE